MTVAQHTAASTKASGVPLKVRDKSALAAVAAAHQDAIAMALVALEGGEL